MLDWDHNAYYHRLLLRLLPAGCSNVLDVGCGAGSFASKLAQYVDHVDAIDLSPAMIELARQRVGDNVTCIHGEVMTHSLPAAEYDAVVSICALHHMNLEQALARCAGLLRPGGVLALIALPRKDLKSGLLAEIVAAFGHRVLGAVFLVARSAGLGDWFAKDSTHSAMPVVLAPELTTREVADRAAAVLPGVRVCRLVFWRYLLQWEKPA